MARIDTWFIVIGLLFALTGMAVGIWTGINRAFEFSSLHAHINLVGFVMSVLFGLIHRAYPQLRGSVLATAHFWLHLVGTLVLVAGKYLVAVEGSDVTVATGSLLMVAATLTFVALFAIRADADPAG